MVRLDGHEVFVNDMVHDVARGEGTVAEAQSGKIVVTFGRQRFSYDENGVGNFNRKTLYWCDPVLVAPPRDRVQWMFISQMGRAMFAALKEHAPKVMT